MHYSRGGVTFPVVTLKGQYLNQEQNFPRSLMTNDIIIHTSLGTTRLFDGGSSKDILRQDQTLS